ncbi:MAG: hypothetical protein M3R55_05225 [Acidobacteriota bacterium]|nr:hypothetical protein [Acidobacteriota bacterium]
MTRKIALGLAVLCVAGVTLRADVKTTERGSVKFEGMLGRMISLFGGAKDINSTVAVRGNRKAALADGSGRIIDLGEEKIYDIDAKKKSYKVTTFAELRRQIEDAREKAKKDAEEAGEQAPPEQGAPEVEIDFDVKETGATKSLAGHDTRQVIATVTMRQKGKSLEQGGGLVLTSDMWLAPRIAAIREIHDFDRRYSEKLMGMVTTMSADQLAALLALHPGFQKAQERMAAEGTKLDGTALLTTLTLESVKDPSQQAAPASGAGGLAGRLMRRGQEKPGTKNRVFSSTHETLSIAGSVAEADVTVPAGFKERQ